MLLVCLNLYLYYKNINYEGKSISFKIRLVFVFFP